MMQKISVNKRKKRLLNDLIGKFDKTGSRDRIAAALVIALRERKKTLKSFFA